MTKMTGPSNAEKALQEANPHRLMALMIANTGEMLSDLVVKLEDPANPNRVATMREEWFKHLKVGVGCLAMTCEELQKKAERDDAAERILCDERKPSTEVVAINTSEMVAEMFGYPKADVLGLEDN